MDGQAPSSASGPEPRAERIQDRPLPPFPTEAQSSSSSSSSPVSLSDAAPYQQFVQVGSTIGNDATGQYERWSNPGFRGSPGDYAQNRTESDLPAVPIAAESRSRGSSASYIGTTGGDSSAIEGPSWTSDRHRSPSYSSRRQSATSGHPSMHSAASNRSDGSSGLPSNRDRYRNPPPERAESFVVPRWQPDVEATLCPICHTQFSFFVRKHHCRKCGRVVCNSCSPHRITIPYQYIVQPPVEGAAPLTASSRTRPARDPERMGSSAEVASLGGGERVRLCNPCVPDPNIAPPQTNPSHTQQPTSSPARHGRSASGAIASYGLYQRPQVQPNRQTGPISVREALANTPRRPREPSIFGNNSGTNYYSHTQHMPGRGSSYNQREDPRLGMDAMEARSRSSTIGAPSRGHHHMSNVSAPTGEAITTTSQRYSSLIPRTESDLSRPLPPRPQPRPQIPEEDECWVCHKELPSRTLPDFETLRSQHVESCIVSAMQGSSPSPALPTQNTTPQPSSSTATTTPAAPSTSQPRVESPSPAQSRRTGVFPYIATEKDCVDDAECTICLEEFEVGIEMGRLECFCRFHLKCIRDWFGSKPGQCPVHQHAGGY